jgi:hypothetical protein
LSFRAFLVLARYNGFRGSICVTDMVELIQGIPSGRVYMRETRFTRVSLLRRLPEAKPDECLSNISHAKQTYVETNRALSNSNWYLIPFDLMMRT